MDPYPASRAASRPASGLLTALLTVTLGGCTLVNAPGASPSPGAAPGGGSEAVAREFGGQLSMGRSSLPVVLSVVIRGEEVEEALLAVPELSMEARGDGYLREGRMVLELEYGDGCRGQVRVSGEVEEGGWGFQGVLSARDCTGSEEGALILRLRTESGGAAPARSLVVESAPPGA